MSLSTPKGTHDLLPQDLATWHKVEQLAGSMFEAANFQEIRTPVFETTELFQRGVGESTDIVNKEMYTFEKGDRLLTLRPENTAGVVRAYIQHGMDRWPKPVKLYYLGPMFRYERPQAGRQRQFHQVGVEVFGVDSPQADALVITLAFDFLKALGLSHLSLEINNVGCFECRDAFRQGLRSQVAPHLDQLCEDCRKRYDTNPLRMLDCKVPADKAIYSSPEMTAFLSREHTCETCQAHYTELKAQLDQLEIPYSSNPMLVRGLDYYTRTVFEITSTQLGAQSAVCGGGRYNGLVKQLGGPDTPAVGWAMGMERLVSLMQAETPKPLPVFIASDEATEAMTLARQLREAGFRVDLDLSGKALGKQIALANKLQAQTLVVLGETERASGTVTVKNMATGHQQTFPIAELNQALKQPDMLAANV